MTAVALESVKVRVSATATFAAAVVVVAALVAWWASVPYVVGVWHDDGVYALLGRAIASGQGFIYTQLPGAPAATHYPPLYPLLLAVVWRLAPSFPDNISAFLALNAMLVGIAALGAFQFTRARLGWRDDAAAAFALVASCATPVLALSGAVLSEPMFLAGLWPVLYAADRAADTGDARDDLMAGASIGALMLVRTHAVALLAAFVLVSLRRRRPRSALRAVVIATLVILPWQLWTMLASPRVPAPLAGAYGSYLGWFVAGLREGGLPFALATVRLNAMELWLLLQDRVVTGSLAFATTSATLVLLGAALGGGWALARRAPVTSWFLVLYVAIVLVWPYTPWRFLWAVWPLVLLFVSVGAWRLATVAPSRAWQAVVVACLALPAFGMVRTEWTSYASRAWSAPALRAGAQIAPLITWVGRNTRPTDVVLAEGEQVISLFTGRRAAPTAPFTAREYITPRSLASATTELHTMLALVPARFVLPLAPVQIDAARALAQSRPGLREIAPLPNGAVFEVLR
jgi:hypothetical protein